MTEGKLTVDMLIKANKLFEKANKLFEQAEPPAGEHYMYDGLDDKVVKILIKPAHPIIKGDER